VHARPTGLEEVVPAAIASLGDRGRPGHARRAETLPPPLADPALLERALANLIDNAISASAPDRPVRVEAGTLRDWLTVVVVDQGTGIAAADRPFQRRRRRCERVIDRRGRSVRAPSERFTSRREPDAGAVTPDPDGASRRSAVANGAWSW
jgi:light-regulated signal transduction histidine kinase (bacteriophytochrome)